MFWIHEDSKNEFVYCYFLFVHIHAALIVTLQIYKGHVCAWDHSYQIARPKGKKWLIVFPSEKKCTSEAIGVVSP